MVGKSTCGNGATGRNGKETRPTKASAVISSVVATGRRMNGSEMFTSCSLPPPPAGGARTQTGGRAGRNRGVALDLVLTLGHDALTAAEARGDDRQILVGRADLDRTRLRQV